MGDVSNGSVPDDHHVSRLCGFSQLENDGRPNGMAFLPKVKAGVLEDYLSVNWLECICPTDRAVALDGVRAALLAKKLKLPATGCLAVLNVGATRNYVRSETEDKRELTFAHEPMPPEDISHSGIYGLQHEQDLVADLVADTVIEVAPART